MDERQTRVAVIIASTRTGRFGPTVAQWFTSVARQRADLDVDVIDLAETDLPDASPGDGPAPAPVRDLAPRLGHAELHATTIRDVVSFHNYPERFNPQGTPHNPTAEAAAKTQLDQLLWWAHALRNHRTQQPYQT